MAQRSNVEMLSKHVSSTSDNNNPTNSTNPNQKQITIRGQQIDESMFQNIVHNIVKQSKKQYMNTRNGQYWIPELNVTEMIHETLQVIWRDNIYVQDKVNKLVKEPNWQTNIRAFVAIYGNVLLWISCWNMLTNNYENEYNNYMFETGYRKYVDIGYCILGLFIMIYNGTLYQTAGYEGSTRTTEYFSKHIWWKAITSLIAQFMFTIGCWDLLYLIGYDTSDFSTNDPYNYKYITKDIILYGLGFFLIIFTNSFWTIASVVPPWFTVKYIPPELSTILHIRHIILSVLSLIGFNCVWASLFDFLLDYNSDGVWRDLFYVSIGLLIFIATGSFVSNSLIWEGIERDDDDDAETQEFLNKRTPTVFVIYSLRGWLSLMAQITHNAGAWMLLDTYIVSDYRFIRDCIYFLLGVLSLAWSKALLLNASITPFSIPITPDGLAMAYNDGMKKNANLPNEVIKAKTDIFIVQKPMPAPVRYSIL